MEGTAEGPGGAGKGPGSAARGPCCKVRVPFQAAAFVTAAISLLLLCAAAVAGDAPWGDEEPFCVDYWEGGGWHGRKHEGHGEDMNSSDCLGETADEALLIARYQHSEFCEAIQVEAFVRQPANSWSAGAYFFAGGWSWGHAWRSRHIASMGWPMFVTEGICLITLGLGTFFYHASYKVWANQLDVVGMEVALTSSVATSLWRAWRRWGPPGRAPTTARGFAFFLVPLALATAAMDLLRRTRSLPIRLETYMFLLVGTIWLLEGLLLISQRCSLHSKAAFRKDLCVALPAVSFAVAGFFWWNLGKAEKKALRGASVNSGFCDPASPFQPHALWHVLTGAAFLFMVELHGAPPPVRCRPNFAAGCGEVAPPETVGAGSAA